jgi:hypothetical protein
MIGAEDETETIDQKKARNGQHLQHKWQSTALRVLILPAMAAIDEVLPLGCGVQFPRSIQITRISVLIRELAGQRHAEA